MSVFEELLVCSGIDTVQVLETLEFVEESDVCPVTDMSNFVEGTTQSACLDAVQGSVGIRTFKDEQQSILEFVFMALEVVAVCITVVLVLLDV